MDCTEPTPEDGAIMESVVAWLEDHDVLERVCLSAGEIAHFDDCPRRVNE
jgi:hypothetical protein